MTTFFACHWSQSQTVVVALDQTSGAVIISGKAVALTLIFENVNIAFQVGVVKAGQSMPLRKSGSIQSCHEITGICGAIARISGAGEQHIVFVPIYAEQFYCYYLILYIRWSPLPAATELITTIRQNAYGAYI